MKKSQLILALILSPTYAIILLFCLGFLDTIPLYLRLIIVSITCFLAGLNSGFASYRLKTKDFD